MEPEVIIQLSQMLAGMQSIDTDWHGQTVLI